MPFANAARVKVPLVAEMLTVSVPAVPVSLRPAPFSASKSASVV
jgi:hypothetical protein